MKFAIKTNCLYLLFLLNFIATIKASPELIVQNDDRNMIEVAEFGFLPGGRLTLNLMDLKWHELTGGVAAFYIRKGRILQEEYNSYGDRDHILVDYDQECFLNNSFIRDEVNDGVSLVEYLPEQATEWTKTIEVKEGEQGLWEVLFVSCRPSRVSFKLLVDQLNPNGNYLSAGDIPLPYVYAFSSVAYAVIAVYWTGLLILNKNNVQVFRAHWLMFVLLLCIVINKLLLSLKYHYMRLGLLSEGWKIGFYVFACIKGILSLLIIVLLASGWTFIKPFLSTRDKRIISMIIPLQVLANIASAIGNETALGSSDWPYWNTVLPLIDLASCSAILWTILQTKKHLASAASVDGKEQDVLNKYKLWSSFYLVTLVYIYITRIIVQLLQACLPFQYVTWFGEAVNEVTTFLFYVFVGYKFRPYPNNPYIQ
ncbi:hypothetical protein CU098_000946, partial [Rhizopus stolonifer]